RDGIVAAAVRLFYGRGIGQVGLDAVRDESGVSLTSTSREFPSKEDLVLAVLAHRHAMWTDGVERAVARTTDPRERLLAVYAFLAEWFTERDFRGCGVINALGALGA